MAGDGPSINRLHKGLAVKGESPSEVKVDGVSRVLVREATSPLNPFVPSSQVKDVVL